MARAFVKEQNFTGRLYTDQQRVIYKALCCKRGAKYSLSMKTISAAKEAYAEGYRQGPTAGDTL